MANKTSQVRVLVQEKFKLEHVEFGVLVRQFEGSAHIQCNTLQKFFFLSFGGFFLSFCRALFSTLT